MLSPGWIFETRRVGEKGLAWGDPAPGPAPLIYRLWATRADSGASVLLEESRGPLTSPCWSPDGRALAFGRLVPEAEGRARFEVVIQEAPNHKTVLFTRPYHEFGARSVDLPGLALAWSPDGRYLAVPMFQQSLGLALIRADNGRLLKEEKDAYFPAWSPDGTRLAFLSGSDAESLYVLDDNFGPARHLAEIGQASQAPIWSRDGRSVAVVTHALSQRHVAHPTQQFDLIRIQVESGKVETLTLDSEPGDRDKTYNGASFTFDRDGEELFYSLDIEGQPSQIIWFRPRTQETYKKFHPLDHMIPVGSLALTPTGGMLAFRSGSPGYFSPPALYDLAANRVTLVVPDDAARVEWISTLIAAARTLLQGSLPAAVGEGQVAERPTLLPIPGELDPNQEVSFRLRHLGRLGRPLCDRPDDAPPAPPALLDLLDEARLFFDILCEDYDAALASLETFEVRTTEPDQRLRLLSVRAQILLGQGQSERALEAIAFLRSIPHAAPRRLEITPAGPTVTAEPDPSQGWPSYLALCAKEFTQALATDAEGPENRLGRRNSDAPDLVPAGMVVPFAPRLERFAPEVLPLPDVKVVEPPHMNIRPPRPPLLPRFQRPPPAPRH